MPASLWALPACLGCDGHPCALAQQCGLEHPKVPCPLQSPSVPLPLGTLGMRHPAALPRAAAALPSHQPLPVVGRQRLPPRTAGSSRQASLRHGLVTLVRRAVQCVGTCIRRSSVCRAQEEQVAQVDAAEDLSPLQPIPVPGLCSQACASHARPSQTLWWPLGTKCCWESQPTLRTPDLRCSGVPVRRAVPGD